MIAWGNDPDDWTRNYSKKGDATFAIPNANLSATLNGDWSVSLTLPDGPTNWWYEIDDGDCVGVSGRTASDIAGLGSGTYSVKAYSDSGCGNQIADATFTIP